MRSYTCQYCLHTEMSPNAMSRHHQAEHPHQFATNKAKREAKKAAKTA